MTTEATENSTLESIIGSATEPASPAAEAPVHEPVASPAATPAAAPSQPAQTGDDDDAEPPVVDHEGQKLVPKAALDAERGKRRKYTDQVASFEKKFAEQQAVFDRRFTEIVTAVQRGAQPQPAPQPVPAQPKPDFYDNPEAAMQSALEAALAPVVQHVNMTSEATSRRFAVQEHGQEVVNAAYGALEQRMATDPGARMEYQRIMASPDPWNELVHWHKKESAAAEVGLDPVAYRQKVVAELLPQIKQQVLAELGMSGQPPQPQVNAQQPAAAAPAAPAVMPSNLAGARNAGPRTGPEWGGPAPIKDIFDRRNTMTSRAG